MSKGAKISFLVAVLILVLTFAAQFVIGMQLNLYSLLFAVAGGFVLFAVALDYKMYTEFFLMRTTKHGMNMGAMIVIVVVVLVCVNYLANLHNKTWDLTQEKLNSLSDQSADLLTGLNGDLEFKVFTRGPTAAEEKQKVKQALHLYQDFSGHVKVRYVNPYVDSTLAMSYLNDLPDRDSAATVVFAEYGGKKIRVDQPFDEAAITGAIIKATRVGESKIYFIQGHGEKELDGEGDQGLKELSRALTESSFKVESLNLIDRKQIPKDASAIAIVGPALPYLDSELRWLRDYVRGGGHILLALDPGQRHNLANLTKSLGVQFENNYIITLQPVVGGGPAMILGRSFDGSSDITKNIARRSSLALFYLASEVTPAKDKPESILTKELVKTDSNTFTMNDLKQPVPEKPLHKVVNLAVESSGLMASDEASTPAIKSEAKPFEAVVFGDSDFMANRSFPVGVNKDLALNTFAKLGNQKDLLSLRPKVPRGSMLIMNNMSRLLMVCFTLGLPLLLLVISGVVWFRRRGA